MKKTGWSGNWGRALALLLSFIVALNTVAVPVRAEGSGKENAIDLILNEEMTVTIYNGDGGETTYFRYIPEATAVYRLSIPYHEYAGGVVLYDVDDGQLFYFGSRRENNNVLTFDAPLEAGQTYYLEVQSWEETGDIPVKLTYAEDYLLCEGASDSFWLDKQGDSATLQPQIITDRTDLTWTWQKACLDGYDWETLDEHGNSITVSAPGQYSFKAADNVGNEVLSYFYVFLSYARLDYEIIGSQEVVIQPGTTAQIGVEIYSSDQEVHLQWFHNGDLIDGEEEPLLETSVGGEYRLIMTDDYGNKRIAVFSVIMQSQFSAWTEQEYYSIEAGDTAELRVFAEGVGEPFSYQWCRYEDGLCQYITIENETEDTLLVQRRGQYKCIVSDVYGSQAEVYIYVDVFINWYLEKSCSPSDTVAVGETVTMSVEVWDAPENSVISYQWYEVEEAMTLLEGANDSSYTVTFREPKNYCCLVTEENSGVDSYVWFELSLENHLVVSTQQNWFNVHPGESVTLEAEVSADDMDGITYTWFDTAMDDPLATQVLSITLTDVRNFRTIQLEVQDAYGNFKRITFYIDIDNDFRIFYDGYHAVAPGSDCTLEVIASAYDMDGITYSWSRWEDTEGEWVSLNGAAGPSYTINSVTKYGEYKCSVTDGYGGVRTAYFEVTVDNQLTLEPADGEDTKYVLPGDDLTLTVTASAADMSQLEYYWHRYDPDTGDWTPLGSGSNMTSYALHNVTAGSQYRCIVLDQYNNQQEVCFTVRIVDSESGLAWEPIDEETCMILGIGRCRDTDLQIPAYINGYKVSELAANAFENCTQLQSVTVPAGVNYLSSGAFIGCTSLEKVTLPESFDMVGYRCFDSCTGLKEINLPEGMTGISDFAFYGCSALVNMKLPSTLNYIGGNAFNGCSSLKSVVIPWGLTWLGYNTFSYCTALESLALPNSLESIGDGCFFGCESLTEVVLSEGFVSLGGKAFSCCTALKQITLPVSLQYVGYNCFNGCSALEKVIYAGSDEEWAAIYISDGNEPLLNAERTSDSGYVMVAITKHPQDLTVVAGDTASFTVEAEGNGLTYQWYYKSSASADWAAVSAASGKTATYSLTAAARHNGYQYRCEVTDGIGIVTSDAATLTVISKPTITTQPTSATVAEGAKATFKIVASGDGLNYQWYYQKPGATTWTAVSSNGTSAKYTLTTAARHNGYSYKCVVTNEAGSVTSDIAVLTVIAKPTITTQPKSVTVAEGAKATFKVVASGDGLSYQWYYQKPGATTWTAVSSNGTSAKYTLTTAARHNGYSYKCVVTNEAGSVTSSVATLTVN
ncbi:MAG: leucine-rich repeat protein [Lachnospiraceae bacterium]|nr:leucine-rich repeat protein [Lachnospiraceae bacterium]